MGCLLISLKTVILNIVNEYLRAIKLSNIIVGNIKSVAPLRISIDKNVNLPVDFFTFNSRTKYLKYKSFTEEIGQKVVLVRAIGGQKYYVIDKLEDTSEDVSFSILTSYKPINFTLSNQKIVSLDEIVLSSSLSNLTSLGERELQKLIGKKYLTFKDKSTGKYIITMEMM